MTEFTNLLSQDYIYTQTQQVHPSVRGESAVSVAASRTGSAFLWVYHSYKGCAVICRAAAETGDVACVKRHSKAKSVAFTLFGQKG